MNKILTGIHRVYKFLFYLTFDILKLWIYVFRSSQNLQGLANERSRQLGYVELKKEYDLRKQEFQKWCDDNRNAAGSAPYENYIREFKMWEAQMLREIEKSAKSTPDEDSEDSDAEGDLETQLRKVLDKCNRYQFTLGLLHAKTVDPNLFTAICKVSWEK